MKVEYIATNLSLPKGFRVKQYETVAELIKDAGNESFVVAAVNKYLRQKSALVAGRDDLATLIEERLKFPPTLKKVKKGDAEVDTWAETENEYINRFASALIAGKVTIQGLTFPAGANDEQKEAAVWVFIQTLADACGDTDKDGKALETPPCYVLDIKTPERSSKPKKLPQYAIDGATNIINNKSEKKWIERFTKGYKNANDIQIDPINFQPFDTQPAKGAKPEDIQAVRDTNIKNLAAALVADREQVLAKTAKAEYA